MTEKISHQQKLQYSQNLYKAHLQVLTEMFTLQLKRTSFLLLQYLHSAGLSLTCPKIGCNAGRRFNSRILNEMLLGLKNQNQMQKLLIKSLMKHTLTFANNDFILQSKSLCDLDQKCVFNNAYNIQMETYNRYLQ